MFQTRKKTKKNIKKKFTLNFSYY